MFTTREIAQDILLYLSPIDSTDIIKPEYLAFVGPGRVVWNEE